MRWLSDPLPGTVAEAVRALAPGLAGRPVAVREVAGREDPLWHASTALVGDAYVAKFAWSRPAARRVAHEIRVLAALAGAVPCLPDVVAASLDPVLLITERVAGESLFQVADRLHRDKAGEQLATFLAALHHPETRRRVEAAAGPLPGADEGPGHPPPPELIRERIGAWLRPHQRPVVRDWLDRAGASMARRPGVLVHSDFHGDNQVWRHGELRLVVDFETAAVAEPEYDLRALPAVLLPATIRHYERVTDCRLDAGRVWAWRLLTVLGDALWRSEAGLPMPGHPTAADWVDDLIHDQMRSPVM